jgi:NADP-dependent 3-hydroxy acid dehydrogenase YdfG
LKLPATPSFRLDGKRALVTGASRGIGLGGAMALAEAGAHVVMAARNKVEIGEAADAICSAGYSAQGISLDVSDLKSVEAAISEYGLLSLSRLDSRCVYGDEASRFRRAQCPVLA